jgi:signal transduction histidine kinase
MELSVAKFDLPTTIADALAFVRERANRHGIVLNVQVDARLNSFAGDERRVKQILLNLLSNAVKFTPEGGSVFVAAAPTGEGGGVQISVRDTGIGISKDNQQLLFQAFQQVRSEDGAKREGTGLGLALAKRITEMHGGSIWVDSEPGKGSTFTFTLAEQPWQTS